MGGRDLPERARRFEEDVYDLGLDHRLWPDAGPILVGVSGGIDSMVLLHVLHRLFARGQAVSGGSSSASMPRSPDCVHPIVAAHVNYNLREGADGDEALVREVCASFSPPIPLDVHQAGIDVPSGHSQTSLQEQARDIRYAFFAERARVHGANVVAVGHHRQDQAETLLLRLFRGAGPEALAAMRPSRPLGRSTDTALVRPLLQFGQEKILAYAEETGVTWREDPTNTSGAYARTTLRTQVLPAIERAFPGATGQIAHAADLLGQVSEATLRPERLRWQSKIVKGWTRSQRDSETSTGPATHSPQEEAPGDTDLAQMSCSDVVLSASGLRQAPDVWRDRVILDALRATVPSAPQTTGMARAVAALLDGQTGKRVETGEGAVWRERGGLRVVSQLPSPFKRVPLSPGCPAQTPEGCITMRLIAPRRDPLSYAVRADSHASYLDADALLETAGSCAEAQNDMSTGLRVRRWRAGDRIQPLGMLGTKTVADLLTDAKVPPHEREHVLVVTAGGSVVWVVGQRIDHRVRLKKTTEQIVELRLHDENRQPG